MRRSPRLVAVTVAIAVAGCGGGDDQSSTVDTTASTPEAAEPVTELVSAIEQLDPQGDCEQAVKLIHPADLIEPEGGASPANCEAAKVLVEGLSTFEPSESAEFGTGAIIDGDADGKPVALDVALDQTKSFKVLGVTTRGPQIGTEPSPEIDFEAPAAALVEAMREDDCKAAHAAIASISRLARTDLDEFCSTFDASYESDPATIGARLQADPNADLVDLGGTRNSHFFGLATKPAGYRTIFVGTVKGGEPLVMDVLPVER